MSEDFNAFIGVIILIMIGTMFWDSFKQADVKPVSLSETMRSYNLTESPMYGGYQSVTYGGQASVYSYRY